MTEKKKNSNPFIRMAQQAKESANTFPIKNDRPNTNTSAPKPTPGFGNKIIKKTGRA